MGVLERPGLYDARSCARLVEFKDGGAGVGVLLLTLGARKGCGEGVVFGCATATGVPLVCGAVRFLDNSEMRCFIVSK